MHHPYFEDKQYGAGTPLLGQAQAAPGPAAPAERVCPSATASLHPLKPLKPQTLTAPSAASPLPSLPAGDGPAPRRVRARDGRHARVRQPRGAAAGAAQQHAAAPAGEGAGGLGVGRDGRAVGLPYGRAPSVCVAGPELVGLCAGHGRWVGRLGCPEGACCLDGTHARNSAIGTFSYGDSFAGFLLHTAWEAWS